MVCKVFVETELVCSYTTVWDNVYTYSLCEYIYICIYIYYICISTLHLSPSAYRHFSEPIQETWKVILILLLLRITSCWRRYVFFLFCIIFRYFYLIWELGFPECRLNDRLKFVIQYIFDLYLNPCYFHRPRIFYFIFLGNCFLNYFNQPLLTMVYLMKFDQPMELVENVSVKDARHHQTILLQLHLSARCFLMNIRRVFSWIELHFQ